MIALVATEAGSFAVDLDEEEIAPWEGDVTPPPAPILNLAEEPKPHHAADALAVAICHAMAPRLAALVGATQ